MLIPCFDTATGLIPAVVQDANSGTVLMVGYMNATAYERTCSEGVVTFFSRSRQRLWTKGETSGNTLQVISMHLDCDGDAILVRAVPAGPTCHTGSASCFGDIVSGTVSELQRIVIGRREADPGHSFTAAMLQWPLVRLAQKVGEEGVEASLAIAVQDDGRVVSEVADMVYVLTTALAARGLAWDDVHVELRSRMNG